MHQSFVSTTPEVFNFTVVKARLKARHCGVIAVVKSLLKAGPPEADNFMEQQLVVVPMKIYESDLNFWM